MNSITEFHISSTIFVTSTETKDLLVELRENHDQNSIGQIISAISQEFNQKTNENLEKAMQSNVKSLLLIKSFLFPSDGISPTQISVSSLGQNRTSLKNFLSNQSAMEEFNEQMNLQAELRENLSEFTTNVRSMTIESIKLQLSTLIQLTETTNQLTRQTFLKISNKCHQLAKDLHSLSIKVPYEDIQMAGQQLLQCSANILTVNLLTFLIPL